MADLHTPLPRTDEVIVPRARPTDAIGAALVCTFDVCRLLPTDLAAVVRKLDLIR